jgi:RNA exonuclease 4
MGKPFFTKKQKAKMRERRKKKKLTILHDNGDNDGIHKELDTSYTTTSTTTTTKSSIDHSFPDPEKTLINSKKRPRVDEEEIKNMNGTMNNDSNNIITQSESTSPPSELTTKLMDGKLYVLLPSNLSAKDAKKFRKDARRNLREHFINKDEQLDTIEFVTEEEMPSLQPSKKKRKQKEFPSIKELLKQKRHIEEIQKEENKLKEKLNAIPEAVRAQYVAMDCEMVGIGTDGRKSALARVSLVDWNHNVVLDTFVKVPIRVTDFRTHVSGVEPKHIKNQNAMDVKKCRELVAKLLKDKILVGHALTNDLKALMLTHPKEKIRDTAKYRPFQRYGNGKWRARKLRDLVKENLKGKEGFQENEHDSVQDATGTMELFQLVFSQWEKELANKVK